MASFISSGRFRAVLDASDLYHLNPQRVAAITEAQRAALTKPPVGRAHCLGKLEACGLVEFARLIGEA